MYSQNLPIELSNDNVVLLNKKAIISDFKREKFLSSLQTNWDKFYNRNKDNFFKDRNWLESEFRELDIPSECQKSILEIGCGVGNTVIPLLKRHNNIFIYACDFSKNAIEILKESLMKENLINCNAFVCDITKHPLSQYISSDSIHYALLIFTLSALSLKDMSYALKEIYRVLIPGGKVLLRDYGLHDYAMTRFKLSNKLSESQYVRQDGTLSYFFNLEELKDLFTEANFLVDECMYVKKDFKYEREKDNIITRIFVQAKFSKECYS